MNSDDIKKILKNFSESFDFNQLQNRDSPFIQVAVITPDDGFSEVSVSTFLRRPNSSILSPTPGQFKVKWINKLKEDLIPKIPFITTNWSVSSGEGKTRITQLELGLFIIVSVLTEYSRDQDLLVEKISEAFFPS